MSCSMLVKKEQCWYIIPDSINKEELILSILEKEVPEGYVEGMELEDILRLNGWQIQEYRDLAGVA